MKHAVILLADVETPDAAAVRDVQAAVDRWKDGVRFATLASVRDATVGNVLVSVVPEMCVTDLVRVLRRLAEAVPRE